MEYKTGINLMLPHNYSAREMVADEEIASQGQADG